jgi:hypothetical protein
MRQAITTCALERAMKLIVLVAVVLGVCACGSTGPYRGRVLDADTKQPLVGAVVLVHWNRLTPGLGHGPTSRFLGAEETLTNIHGEFLVAEDPPIVWAPWAWRSRPHFTIFQPGYAFFPRHAQTIPPYADTGYDELLNIMEQRHVVFELPRLVDRADRLEVVRAINSMAVSPPLMPELGRLLDIERAHLHLPPLHGGSEPRSWR